MDAASALADLTELSAQIEAAAIVDGEGALLAEKGAGADRLARAGVELMRTAEERFGRGDRRLTQLEVALREGSLFVVRGDGRSIVARTPARPASALVLHDLATCLDAIAATPRRSKKATVDA